MDVVQMTRTGRISDISDLHFRYRVQRFMHHCPLTISCLPPARSLKLRTSLHSLRVSKKHPFGDSVEAETITSKLRVKPLEVMPHQVKAFQWERARAILLQCATYVGLKTLKWSLVIYVISFLSDASFSFCRNRELMIPFGMFIGCSLAALIKEISSELLTNIKEEVATLIRLLSVGAFSLLIKHAFQGNLFVSHVCNGALLHVLCWVIELQGRDGDQPTSSLSIDSVAED